MDNQETVFLAKIQNVINLLDEIDEIIDNNPTMQQNIYYQISDYLHIIQRYNDEITTSSKINMINDLANLRKKRIEYNSIFRIGNYYRNNINKLINKDRRQFFRNDIGQEFKKCHEQYQYRVLAKEDVDKLIDSHDEQVQSVKKHRTRTSSIDKETLKEMLDKKMKQRDIAEQFGITPGRVSQLVVKYGLSKRKGDS